MATKFPDLRTPGFTGDASSNAADPFWSVSSSWSTFSCHEEWWVAAYVSWSVYYSTRLIESLCATAQSVAGEGLLLRYQALADTFRKVGAIPGAREVIRHVS